MQEVDTSKLAERVDLASLKSEVDKLDIDKLEKVPTGLKSLKSKVDKLYLFLKWNKWCSKKWYC